MVVSSPPMMESSCGSGFVIIISVSDRINFFLDTILFSLFRFFSSEIPKTFETRLD